MKLTEHIIFGTQDFNNRNIFSEVACASVLTGKRGSIEIQASFFTIGGSKSDATNVMT